MRLRHCLQAASLLGSTALQLTRSAPQLALLDARACPPIPPCAQARWRAPPVAHERLARMRADHSHHTTPPTGAVVSPVFPTTLTITDVRNEGHNRSTACETSRSSELGGLDHWHTRSRLGLVVIGATEAQARRSWPHAGTILVAADLDEAAVLLRQLPRGARVVVRTGPGWQFLCSARTRAGRPCRSRVLRRGGRCKNHGGLSTGPRGDRR